MLIVNILLGVLGVVFLCLGLFVWIKEKIVLIHSYHYDKVAKEDKKAFCHLVGQGIVIIGIGLLSGGIINQLTNSAWGEIAVLAGLFIGLGFAIYAILKYNHS